MNSPAVDIAGILDGVSSLGLTIGTDLFVGDLPDGDTLAVCITDTGGYPPVNALTKEHFDRPTIQIRIRGARGAYTAAYGLALAIDEELHLLAEETVGGTRYLVIERISDILSLGFDEKHRPEFTINYRADRAG